MYLHIGLFMRLQLLGLLPLSIFISVALQIWELLAGGTSLKVQSTASKYIPTIIIFVYWIYVVVHVVYRSLGYIEVAAPAEDSMKLAVKEIKDVTHYNEKGEVHLNVHVYMYFFFIHVTTFISTVGYYRR